MNFDDEIDLLVDKKSAPKQGRRALNATTSESTDELLDSALDSISNLSSPNSAFRAHKTSNWSDEGIKSARHRTVIDDDRFHNQSVIDFDNDDDDIPIIPDIDEIQEDLLGPVPLKAPTILINKSTYKELDRDLTQSENPISELFSMGKDDDIDFSEFLKCLSPEEKIKELDDEWTMESLLNDFVHYNDTDS